MYTARVADESSFYTRLRASSHRSKSLLCVGLDPLPERLPAGIAPTPDGILQFCMAIVDAVADAVCLFKPQFAHFASLGAEAELARLIEYIHERHPGVPVLLDAKRGDIGSTAERYAVELFDRYQADAATVNPYLGTESLLPYLERADRGVVVLCRTSNADSGLIQRHPADDPVYLRVARAAAREWNFNRNVMLVAAATYPRELASIREAAEDIPLLTLGVGSQGADLEATLRAGLAPGGGGLVVSTSRVVLYASAGADFAAAARTRAVALRDQINRLRPHVTN